VENPICSYYQCGEHITNTEIGSKDSMKFCEAHLKEITKLVELQDVKGILKFWIKAQGGAKLAARRCLHG
jgi:hypothetical protein